MKSMILASVLSMAFSFTSYAKLVDEQPNIIFILVDDMGYSDIGCYGGDINTPNLDRNETTDLKEQCPESFGKLRSHYDAWEKSVVRKSELNSE